MLASMRQEETQAHLQAAEQVEQIRLLEAQSSKPARHLEEVMQSSLGSLRAETQQYTDQACDGVRSEVQGELQTLRGEVETLQEEVRTTGQRHMAMPRAGK